MTRPPDDGAPIDAALLDIASLTSHDAGGIKLDDAQAEARELLAGLFVCVKLALLYDAGNKAVLAPCERLAAAANRIRERGDGVASLTFQADGVYASKLLVKLDGGSFEQAQYLFSVMSKLGIGEVAAVEHTAAADWLEFMVAFQGAVGPKGDLTSLRQTRFARIRLRPPAGAQTGDLRYARRLKALRLFASLVLDLKETLDRVRLGKRPTLAKVKRAVQDLVGTNPAELPLLFALTAARPLKGEPHHHLANSAVAALAIGRQLGLGERDLCELCLRAAVHDVGRGLVPASEVPDPGRRLRGELARTVEILARLGADDPAMLGRIATATEVQKWLAKARDQAPDPSVSGAGRIVAVAHAWDLLTTVAPGRPALAADEALLLLLHEAGRRYDVVAVKALVAAVGIFPVGSLVELSTGDTAVVIEPPAAAAPARPQIKLVRDANGGALDGPVVDLARVDPGHRIVRCIDPQAARLNPVAHLLA